MNFSAIEHVDWFQLFGLPKRFMMDLEALENAYLRAQNIAHPDAWGALSSKSANQLSAYINAAYLGLKDPRQRAEYMLKCVKAWPPALFQDIIKEVFLLKSEENEEIIKNRYQEAMIKFEDSFQKEDYLQAQHAYTYICYLKN